MSEGDNSFEILFFLINFLIIQKKISETGKTGNSFYGASILAKEANSCKEKNARNQGVLLDHPVQVLDLVGFFLVTHFSGLWSGLSVVFFKLFQAMRHPDIGGFEYSM